MTTTLDPIPTATTAPSTGGLIRGRWLEDWRPEDERFWDGGGRAVARRNLLVSVFSEHIGFSIWSLWSVFVLFLGPNYGISADPKQAAAEKFMLTIVPTAIGSAVRLPYTFAVAKFGGRNWTVISAALLLVPLIATGIALKPGTSYATLLILAALAGVGGGNFASSMTNINSFFPQRLKGAALGLNAGGGNIGVATVQLIGLLVIATAGKDHPRVLVAIYLPLVVIAIAAAALLQDNITNVRNEKRAMRDACADVHTWLISLLYIGTFGSFIGFGFAFGQVLSNEFGSHFLSTATGRVDPVKVMYLTFLGPLTGSLVRPVGGWLADRLGGARTTLWNFAAMAAAGIVVLVASEQGSLPLFLVGFMALFVFSGIGNGSVYKMIPAVFRLRMGGDQEARRIANAVIGIAGAIGAFGGVLVNIAFRQSFLSSGNGDAAYVGFIAFYALCLAVTWAVYVRPSENRAAGI
ncbi:MULTISPECIES: NarK/NasA family nitrate transporter [unclassified Parafrankia]|uniref:nitrate/nitrite transporter n=1 Tax=unclassified Parafrankia TaxID=2994368 RepID=UPI000DA4911C|nr:MULTISPECIES: nitrate/nitrite transporter [unclassified Parafrankia]TCJ31717.1 NarK/NasA family nitrate transporter [Parafrankia sp. BMG5.11]SQD97905.1 Major facilitator superfamily MFS_1 [Parafrankia sp. Ea1.12]